MQGYRILEGCYSSLYVIASRLLLRRCYLCLISLCFSVCILIVEQCLPKDILYTCFPDTKVWTSPVGGWVIFDARGCNHCAPTARAVPVFSCDESKLAHLKTMKPDELIGVALTCEAHTFLDLRESVLSKLSRGQFYTDKNLRILGARVSRQYWQQACDGYKPYIKFLEKDEEWCISVQDTYFLLVPWKIRAVGQSRASPVTSPFFTSSVIGGAMKAGQGSREPHDLC
jgi:hypothetical protein